MNEEQRIRDRESRLRSIAKAITYRVTGSLTTAVLVYLVSGKIELAVAMGSIEPFVKIVVYYVHERLWAMVPHGTFRRIGTNLHKS